MRERRDPVPDAQPKAVLLEGALRELVKLIKAIRFYPPGHPALQGAVTGAHAAFVPLLQEGEQVVCTVRKGGLWLGETQVGASNPLLQKLARFLFARRLQTFLVLPDLTGTDLFTFVRALSLEPTEIQQLGGLPKILHRARVTTLWVNEVDLKRIRSHREELERQKKNRTGQAETESGDKAAPWLETAEHPDAGSATEEDLGRLLRALEKEPSDQGYRRLLQQIIPLVRRTLTSGGRPLVLGALTLLSRNSTDQHLSAQRRESSIGALRSLATDDVLDYLVATLCVRGQSEDDRQRVVHLLFLLGRNVPRRLMEHLVAETRTQARKFLAEALIRSGPAAVPVLLDHLGDDRWYVVRNAVAVLGGIRAPEAASYLQPQLHHADLRVRREAVRALTRIGGAEAVRILLDTIRTSDADLRLQAILSLGAIRDPAAIPALLRLIRRPDPFLRRLEERKAAVRALGEIGTAAAAPPLIRLLRRRLWYRRRFAELRVAAALSLGEVDGRDAAAALQRASTDRNTEVARAAAQALRQLHRGEE